MAFKLVELEKVRGFDTEMKEPILGDKIRACYQGKNFMGFSVKTNRGNIVSERYQVYEGSDFMYRDGREVWEGDVVRFRGVRHIIMKIDGKFHLDKLYNDNGAAIDLDSPKRELIPLNSKNVKALEFIYSLYELEVYGERTPDGDFTQEAYIKFADLNFEKDKERIDYLARTII